MYLDDLAGCLTTADAGLRADLDGAPMHRLPVVFGALAETTMKKPIADLVRVKAGGPGELLSLPQSFGSTYLGETFSAHMNLHNESDQICYNVELKVSISF
ncbi:unnamed protein product [Echinostoma caproni]|uniref:Trafficking protein particle complex subunit 13 N-terminal domain-containing protein n=1 Tax=Echinostoma caproni TaxID=27848 RepID=A0A3P8HK77_9TREM|nr:unnamed protein product [Echinostoma caproni]